MVKIIAAIAVLLIVAGIPAVWSMCVIGARADRETEAIRKKENEMKNRAKIAGDALKKMNAVLAKDEERRLNKEQLLTRAKTLGIGEWVVGYAVLKKGSWYIYENINILDDKQKKYKVDPRTICRYTGKKDCLGNRIWEEDICCQYGELIGIVRECDGDWSVDWSYKLKAKTGTNHYSLQRYNGRGGFRVCGNTFDTPQLLTKEKIPKEQ